MAGAFFIGIIFFVISLIVSGIMKKKFKKYSKTALMSGLSGREAAEKMLSDHGIHNVKVMCVPGELTDHYNPSNKTVNLSPDVYEGRSTASVAVATHECGHAVQHAQSYSMLQLRTTLVPLQNISAQVMNIIVMVGLFGGFFMGGSMAMWTTMIYVIIAAYAVFTLFSFVTLPVEFDASKRALQWIKDNRIANNTEYDESKDALKWAAMTYVVAALGSLATLLYYVSMLAGGDD